MNVLNNRRFQRALVLFGLTALIFLLWTKPSLETYINQSREIKQFRALLGDPQADKREIHKYGEMIKVLKSEIHKLNEQIPKSENRGFLIRDLENLAKDQNIDLLNFMPKEAVPVNFQGLEIDRRLKNRYSKNRKQLLNESFFEAKVLKTTISIDSKGKFEDYLAFFQKLNKYYRAVEVSDLVISRDGEKTELGDDPRFAVKRKRGKTMQEKKSPMLNVAFTLQAYTSLES